MLITVCCAVCARRRKKVEKKLKAAEEGKLVRNPSQDFTELEQVEQAETERNRQNESGAHPT